MVDYLFADIQEFYEDTLLNDRKSQLQKTYETRKIAERWENNPPFGGGGGSRGLLPPLATQVSIAFYCYTVV
jgi:hypothetical protein